MSSPLAFNEKTSRSVTHGLHLRQRLGGRQQTMSEVNPKSALSGLTTVTMVDPSP